MDEQTLIEGAEIYFCDKRDLQVIYASPNGQYFYDAGLCFSYIANNKLGGKPLLISKDMFKEESKALEKKKYKGGKNGSIK